MDATYYVLVPILLVLIPFIWYRNRKFPPGPLGLPIVGYLPWLDAKCPHKNLTKLAEKYGPVYGLSLGNIYTVVISNAKIIKKVLSKDVTAGRAPLYLTHGVMKGCGLICSEGELWKDQRRFVFGCLRQFGCTKIGPQREKTEALIREYAMDFVNFVAAFGETVIDPLGPLRHSLGSAVNRIVFGKSWDRYDETWLYLQYLQEEGPKQFGVAGAINFLPFLRFLPKFKKSINFIVEGIEKTHKYYDVIIEEQNKVLQNKLKETPNYEPDSILQAFLMERKRRLETSGSEEFYNDQQFHYILADLFGAALDTTLSTLSWYFLYLAINTDIQDRVRQDLNSVVQNRIPKMDDLQFLPYVEASIAEAQRIRPAIPVGFPHGTLDDLEIEGYFIPKGTMLMPLLWALHMNEKHWEDPERFQPLRFIDEEGKFFKPEPFMPFQTGKRMCVGDELARMLLFLFISTIIQHFEVKLPDSEIVDLSGHCGITLTPHAYKLSFKKI